MSGVDQGTIDRELINFEHAVLPTTHDYTLEPESAMLKTGESLLGR